MVSIEEYGDFTTAWCPGCGDISILKALKQAMVGLDLAPHRLAVVSGIGQAAKTPHYLRCNFFNGLHGRALPAAQGVKMANPDLEVVAISGDGCSYGEGGNHFLAAIRRNVNMTMLVCDNQIYGLTKGQASPTTMLGQKTKAQPFGMPSAPFQPLAVAVALGIGFAARGFAGDVDHLTGLIQEAVRFEGFALVDILQPCVSFNKVNTYSWYKERVYKLGDDHDPSDFEAAMAKAREFGERIPLGVVRKAPWPTFDSRVPSLGAHKPLAKRTLDREALRGVMETFA